MLVPIAISVLVVPAVCLLLLNVFLTGGYAGRVPSGSGAMGLVLPLLTSIGGAIALLLATWVCAARGGLAWVGTATGLSIWPATLLASLVTVGVGFAAVGAFLAWIELKSPWVPPVGLVCGGLGPLFLGVLLLAGAWAPADYLADLRAPRIFGGVLAAIALAGLGAGAFGVASVFAYTRPTAASKLADYKDREAKRARKLGVSQLAVLREQHATLGPDAPLSIFISALPDTQDDACRDFIITRALQVPELDDHLARLLSDEHPRLRHGCADLIRFAPGDAIRSAWAAPLAKAIRMTADRLRASPDWLNADAPGNPDPIGHLTALAGAAHQLGGGEPLAAALAELAQATREQPEGRARERALSALRFRQPGVPARTQ